MTDDELIERMTRLLEQTYDIKTDDQGSKEITINGNDETSLARSMEAAYLIPEARNRSSWADKMMRLCAEDEGR